MIRSIRRLARRCSLACVALACAGAHATPPRRIVSLNLCGDQYLLALADRGQIAALTQFARDASLSAAADAAHGYPTIKGRAEDVIALDPDLVIAAPGMAGGARAGARYRTLELPPARSYAEIVRQVREVAAAIGHRERGAALIRAMDAALASLPAPRAHGVAAYYQRRGYLSGTGTLVDELMARVGLVNLARTLGRPPLSQLSLEQLVAARPDYLIVEAGSDRVTDQGTELLHHPILADIPRLKLPQAWTICGGPAYVRAARSLSRQIGAR